MIPSMESLVASVASIDARMIDAVRRRIGSDDVVLLRHDRDPRTGAETPVFGVPPGLVAQAQALGLTVEATVVVSLTPSTKPSRSGSAGRTASRLYRQSLRRSK